MKKSIEKRFDDVEGKRRVVKKKDKSMKHKKSIYQYNTLTHDNEVRNNV